MQIVIVEHRSKSYHGTQYKIVNIAYVRTRTCKSLPTFDAKIYYVQIRCYMVTICPKRNDKIAYKIKNIPETG